MKPTRDVLNSAKVREKRKKVLKKRVIVWTVVLSLSFIGFVLLSRLDYFTIKGIVSEKNIVMETDAIQSTVIEHLQGNYFLFIPKNNFLLYPRQAIIRDLYARFPRIKQVTIAHVTTDSLAVEVEEYDPKFLWCGETMPADDASQQCFFLDKDGFAFSPAPYFSGDVYFKFYGRLGDGEHVLGSQLLDPVTVASIYRASQGFRALGFTPYALVIKPNDDYELSVEIPETNPSAYPKILFRKENDVEKIIANLSAALSSGSLASKIKTDRTALQYLDLRYDNKVYYKFSE